MANKFTFRRNLDVGSLEAETDSFLIEAFTDKGDISVLKDTENVRSIVVGRTGSGKSALLTYLETVEENTKRINPEAMSLKYLSNSDIIKYLKGLGTNLDLFYKVLWKHVFIVEFLKMQFGDDVNKENGAISSFIQRFLMGNKKRTLLEYLRKYHDDGFWEKTDIRVRTIEDQVKRGLTTELKLAPEALQKLFNGTLKFEMGDVLVDKKEIANRAQKVISELQADSIYQVYDILKEDIFNTRQKRFYIIIDDLDKDWVDITIVYDLIRALVITINELKGIPGIKVIIALRDNLYEKALQETEARRMQREKFRQLNLNLEWNHASLKELLNKRLALLMRRQYSRETPTIDDIMPKSGSGKLSGFDYMIQRTLLRPRDIIAFFNKCIEKANGNSIITRAILNQAEQEYSRERLEAIDDEWAENFGSIKPLCEFLKGGPPSFKISDLSVTDLERTLLAEIRDNTSQAYKIANDYVLGVNYTFQDALKSIVTILYRVGVLGVKLSPSDATIYTHTSSKSLDPADITENTKCYVHLMFHAALKIALKTE
ncbi:P-loop ATPase, Sll1717 family [Hymenobacter monticola]|uniref:DNA repair ATPase n=1 Tax=Hymenobacter monticola TaxID=1705399 RepID=A0ABY4BAL3_9BACT|nr:hypothetical protein [Hymenobacter monticola]UOE35342.1 hypothetical protein MTP16_06755 [Hymenobacter monticola]